MEKQNKQDKPQKKKNDHKKPNFHKSRDEIDPKLKQEWIDIQEALKLQIIEKDDPGVKIESIKYVAGMDVSLSNEDGFEHLAVASMSVMKYPSMELVYEKHIERSHDIPYCPGFLAFKEIPAMKELFEIFKKDNPDMKLDFVLCDCNGILHCNGCGCASHFGVEVDIPTIGCSKTIFAVDGLNSNMTREIKEKFKKENPPKGTSVELKGKSGRIWGHALKSGDKSFDPLIVSVGHRVSIETAVAVVSQCCTHRVPEPIRYADLKSRELIKKVVADAKKML